MSNLSSFVKRIRDVMRNDAGINGDAQRIEQIAWMLFLKVYDAKEEDWEFEDEKYESIIPEELRWRNWAHTENQGDGLTGDKLLNFVNNKLFPTLKNLEISPDTPIRQSIVRTTFEDANNYMKDGVLLRQIVNIIDELDFGSYEETHAFGEIYETILKELQSAGSAGEFYTPRAVTQFMAKMIKPQIGETMADFACGTGGFLSSWIKELEEVKDAKGSISNEESEKIYNSIYAVEKKQFPYMLCVTNMLLHGLDSPKVYHGNSLINKLLDYTQKDAFDVILMNPPYGGSEKDDIKQNFPADLRSSETADLFMAVIMKRLKKDGRAAVVVSDGFLDRKDTAIVNLRRKLFTDFNMHTIIRLPKTVFSPYTDIATNILFFNNEEPVGYTWFFRVDIPSDRKHFSKTKPMELSHFDECIQWWYNRHDIVDKNGNQKSKKYDIAELLIEGNTLNLCGYPKVDEEILTLHETLQDLEEKKNSNFSILEKSLSSISKFHSMLKLGQSIDSDIIESINKVDFTFLLNINDTLKKSILKEAVQGKLVPQIPDEGDAKEFYKTVIDNNRNLKKSNRKKTIEINEITEFTEIPYDIPENWFWVRLGDLCTFISRGKSPTYSDIKKYPVFAQKCNLKVGGISLEQAQFLDPKTLSKWTEEYHLHNGDVLVNSTGTGTVMRTGLFDMSCLGDYPFVVPDSHVSVIRLNQEIDYKYIYYCCLESYIQNYWGENLAGSTNQKELYIGVIANTLIPLPPKKEQKRIVTAIEKMLPLCEKLGR